MNELLPILSLLFLAGLILVYIIDRRKKDDEQQPKLAEMNQWIVPAIVATLVAHGLISKLQQEELEDLSFDELEAFVLENELFEDEGQFSEWLLEQPELASVGGDSIFGMIDSD